MADHTRTRGRAASLSGVTQPAAAPSYTAPTASPTARPPAPPPPPPPAATQQAITDAKLDLILTRLESLDEVRAALTKQEGRSEEIRKDHAEGITRLTKLLEENQAAHRMDRRELRIVRQELTVVKERYKRLETQLNDIVNQQSICNLRLDGKKEDQSENLKRFIVDLSAAMGVNSMTPADIVSVYRMGKQTQTNARPRPRTIMVTFINQRARNAFFFARATLKNQECYRGIYVNDDVSPTTRRQRDDYRAVAALARQDGTEVRVHTDGLVLGGKKYLLTEPHTLPDCYSISKAKTIESGGRSIFHLRPPSYLISHPPRSQKVK